MNEDKYLDVNRKAWDQKTEFHLISDFYNMAEFMTGKNSLTNAELSLLGDVKGKSILHLQCHFGQDSMSLSRMGAQVTGIDISGKAIEAAQKFALELGLSTQFICTDVYETEKHIHEQFDIVFSSFGTIGWLPDLNRWAEVIHSCLKPEGKFVFVEFHPFVWTFDDNMEKISYDYFKSEPIIEEINGTYADRNAPIRTKTISWNHSLSEVFGALLKTGLQINHFDEYPYSPHNCFANMKEVESGKFMFSNLSKEIPLMYSLVVFKAPV